MQLLRRKLVVGYVLLFVGGIGLGVGAGCGIGYAVWAPTALPEPKPATPAQKINDLFTDLRGSSKLSPSQLKQLFARAGAPVPQPCGMIKEGLNGVSGEMTHSRVHQTKCGVAAGLFCAPFL